MDPSDSVIYIQISEFIFDIIEIMKKPWHTSMVMSPAELSLLYSMKGGGPKHGKEGAVIVSALGDRLIGKLSPVCLADTR